MRRTIKTLIVLIILIITLSSCQFKNSKPKNLGEKISTLEVNSDNFFEMYENIIFQEWLENYTLASCYSIKLDNIKYDFVAEGLSYNSFNEIFKEQIVLVDIKYKNIKCQYYNSSKIKYYENITLYDYDVELIFGIPIIYTKFYFDEKLNTHISFEEPKYILKDVFSNYDNIYDGFEFGQKINSLPTSYVVRERIWTLFLLNIENKIVFEEYKNYIVVNIKYDDNNSSREIKSYYNRETHEIDYEEVICEEYTQVFEKSNKSKSVLQKNKTLLKKYEIIEKMEK